MKQTLCFLLSLMITVSAFTQSFQPVNKNASPEAKKLLNYLYSINGKQILSGEHGDLRWLDTVKNITGKYPAVWGDEFRRRPQKAFGARQDLGRAVAGRSRSPGSGGRGRCRSRSQARRRQCRGW